MYAHAFFVTPETKYPVLCTMSLEYCNMTTMSLLCRTEAGIVSCGHVDCSVAASSTNFTNAFVATDRAVGSPLLCSSGCLFQKSAWLSSSGIDRSSHLSCVFSGAVALLCYCEAPLLCSGPNTMNPGTCCQSFRNDASSVSPCLAHSGSCVFSWPAGQAS